MARAAVQDATIVKVAAGRARARDPAVGAPAGPAIVHLARARDPRAAAVAARSGRGPGQGRDTGPLDPHAPGRRRTDADLSSLHVPMIGDGMPAHALSRQSSHAVGIRRGTRVPVDRARADSCRVNARNHTAMTSPTARSVGRFPGGIDRVPDPRSHRLWHLVMARSWWPGGGR